MSYPFGRSWITNSGEFFHIPFGEDHWSILLSQEDYLRDKYGLVLDYNPDDDEAKIHTDIWQNVKDANWIRFVGDSHGLDFMLPEYSLEKVDSNVFRNIENILFSLTDKNLEVVITIPLVAKNYRFHLKDFFSSGLNLREFLSSRRFAGYSVNWHKIAMKNSFQGAVKMKKVAQVRTKSPSPFSVTIGEVASIATPSEVQEYRERYDIYGSSLSEIGNHFAIRDDAKRVILAKLLGVKPTPGLSIGESINDLVETKVTLWEMEDHDIDLPYDVGNLSANQIRDLYVDDLRQALKYALKDMIDEAAYLVEEYIRERVVPSGGSTPEEDLERLEVASHQLERYGLGDLSLLDFDRGRNEAIISSKRKQTQTQRELVTDDETYYIPFEDYIEQVEELQGEADQFLQKADDVEEGSYKYKGFLQSAVNRLNEAITVCNLAIMYYTDLKNKLEGNFVEYISELMETKNELKGEKETLFEFIILYDEADLVAKRFNWYRYACHLN